MSNNILFGNCDKHIIKVRLQELNRGPQGPQGVPGRDGAIQYTAGDGISINDEGVISATGSGATWGAITGLISNQADLTTALNTKASTAAVQAAQNTANQAVSTANAAQTAAANANAGVAGLSSYLTLNKTEYTATDFSVISGTGTIDSGARFWVESNSDGSVGKFYGTIQVNGTGNENTTVKLTLNTGLRPASQDGYEIVNAGITTTPATHNIANCTVKVNYDGTLELRGYHDNAANGTFYFRVFPCIEFLRSYSAS